MIFILIANLKMFARGQKEWPVDILLAKSSYGFFFVNTYVG